MDQSSSIITYERTGDKVRPLKIRKAWIGEGEHRKFTSVRITLQPWAAVHRPIAWDARVPTRDELIANGTITKPAPPLEVEATTWPVFLDDDGEIKVTPE